MPWLLTSPGHQQPWQWLCKIGRFLSYLRKDFNYMRRFNVEKWHKMSIYIYVPSEKFSIQRVKISVYIFATTENASWLIRRCKLYFTVYWSRICFTGLHRCGHFICLCEILICSWRNLNIFYNYWNLKLFQISVKTILWFIYIPFANSILIMSMRYHQCLIYGNQLPAKRNMLQVRTFDTLLATFDRYFKYQNTLIAWWR